MTGGGPRPPVGLRVCGATAVRLARHPVASLRWVMHHLTMGPGLPVGQVKRMRGLIRQAVGDQDRVLVIGLSSVVRRALPNATLDVVGTDPGRPEVNVVSAAQGAGSLPRRWKCVVVADLEPAQERLDAAAGACLPGGVVVVATPGRSRSAGISGARTEQVLRSGHAHVVVARLPG